MDNKLSDRNRHLLRCRSSESLIDIPTLFAYMIVDEIKHMRSLTEFRDAIQKNSTD